MLPADVGARSPGAGPAARTADGAQADPPHSPGGALPDAPPGARAVCAWPAWEAFAQRFVQADGRLIDPSSPRAHTVSEGQAYALFFALVQGERSRFERILRWTEDNLAAGDLTLRLPAWQWGRRDDGSYGVLDANSASDADLWLAYTLAQAGQLWGERRYRALASLLAERILREETAVVPGLGLTILPGAQGFAPEDGLWRLNPSYLPPFLMRWFATHSGDARWAQLQLSARRVVVESAPQGVAPDWAYYRADAGPAPDRTADGARPAPAGGFVLAALPAERRIAAFDAVRVYLWAGMTSPEDPSRAALLQHFSPMADLAERAGAAPAMLDAAAPALGTTPGPAGFTAALLPLLKGLDRPAALGQLLDRLQSVPPAANAYYDQVLALFGQGWFTGRFAFAADGSLVAAGACAPGTAPP